MGAELQPVRQTHTRRAETYRDNLVLLLINTNCIWSANCTGLVPKDPYMDDPCKVFVGCNDAVLSVSSMSKYFGDLSRVTVAGGAQIYCQQPADALHVTPVPHAHPCFFLHCCHFSASVCFTCLFLLRLLLRFLFQCLTKWNIPHKGRSIFTKTSKFPSRWLTKLLFSCSGCMAPGATFTLRR